MKRRVGGIEAYAPTVFNDINQAYSLESTAKFRSFSTISKKEPLTEKKCHKFIRV